MSSSDNSLSISDIGSDIQLEAEAESALSSRSPSPASSTSGESAATGFSPISEVFGLSGRSGNSMDSNTNTSFNPYQENTSLNDSLPTTSSSNSFHSISTDAGRSNDSVLQESLDGNTAAEIDRIRRFCENVESNLASIGLGSASTPRIVRGNRPRISTADPVEIIDLSGFDYSVQRQAARNRVPDAVIDLCTPVASHQQPSSNTNTPLRTVQRRRLEDPDPVIIGSPSPPKRICERANNSQQDNSYKCPVCLEPVGQRNPTSTKCGHVFCQMCIESAIRTTHKCPMCNHKLTARQTFRIYL